jgi:hypothetical protein
MSLRAITFTLRVVVELIVFAMIFFAVVFTIQIFDSDWGANSAAFSNPFSFNDSLTTGEVIARFWPKEIIISVTIFLLFLAFSAGWFSGLLARIKISGNILIPLLIVLNAVVVVCYILMSNITYPTALGDARLVRVFIVAASSQIIIPILFSINSDLSRPASDMQVAAHMLIFYGIAYVALVTWLNYLQSGEIQIGYKLSLIS